jgi:thymidylate synthase (FAD)
MGNDLTVVNAARVSFDKHHEEITSGDENLIAYLARHGHWTPFGHPQMQFRISAPIFVARQLVKHQVGLVWNELSRRYVDTKPSFYITDEWRSKAENKKQGSGDELIPLEGPDNDIIQKALQSASDAYGHLLNKGVAPEQARMVLPQSTYTEWYWTGSLFAFARVCKLRISPDAQKETQQIVKQISDLAQKKFPISWKYLLERVTNQEVDDARRYRSVVDTISYPSG